MVTFGLDLSHHQGSTLDFAAFRREGVEFAFLKSTEGSDFVDDQFAKNLSKARAAGMLVAAYHYVRSNATAAAQVANVRRVVPLDVPVIPDVEANSGGIQLVHDFVAGLQAAGYHVPLTYLPRWYWQQIGSPSLAGLPSLWSSRYPDNVVGSLADELADVPASYWNGYGGLGVIVLQFSSSARIAGYAPLDANAFRGDRDQLATLLGQSTTLTEEDPMFQTFELPPAAEPNEVTIALPWQGGSGGANKVFAMVCAGAGGMDLHVCHWQRRRPGGDLEPGIPMVPDGTTIPGRDRTDGVEAEKDVHALIVNYTAPLGGSVVVEAAR